MHLHVKHLGSDDTTHNAVADYLVFEVIKSTDDSNEKCCQSFPKMPMCNIHYRYFCFFTRFSICILLAFLQNVSCCYPKVELFLSDRIRCITTHIVKSIYYCCVIKYQFQCVFYISPTVFNASFAAKCSSAFML